MRTRSVGGLIVLILAVAPPQLAGAAPLDRIPQKRAAIEAAKAEYDRLGLQLEPAIQRHDAAVAELGEVRDRIAENTTRIAAIRSSIGATEEALAARLVQAYRNGDDDVLASLFSAGSIQEMLDLADLLERSQLQAAQVMTDLRQSRAELARRERDLARLEQRAEELTQRAARERERIEQGMAAQQNAIRGFEAEIEQLKAEEAERQRRIAAEARRRLAAERAASAAAAAAAAADAPQIGGAAPGDAGQSIPSAPPSDGSLGARAVAAAMGYLGTPYSWGGGAASGPTRGIGRGSGTVGFDCSGLTLYAWAQVGVGLSHFTGSQWNEGGRISSMAELIPGDLVFFGSDLGHMGLYVGGGQMIHAPQTGDVVKISTISSGYYASSFRGGVRPG